MGLLLVIMYVTPPLFWDVVPRVFSLGRTKSRPSFVIQCWLFTFFRRRVQHARPFFPGLASGQVGRTVVVSSREGGTVAPRTYKQGFSLLLALCCSG